MLGVLTGSEGLLGVITEVTVRILRKPVIARAVLLGFSELEAAETASERSLAPASFQGAWR